MNPDDALANTWFGGPPSGQAREREEEAQRTLDELNRAAAAAAAPAPPANPPVSSGTRGFDYRR